MGKVKKVKLKTETPQFVGQRSKKWCDVCKAKRQWEARFRGDELLWFCYAKSKVPHPRQVIAKR